MNRVGTSFDLNMDAQKLAPFVHCFVDQAVLAGLDWEVAFFGSLFLCYDGLFSILFLRWFFVSCLLLVLASLLLLFLELLLLLPLLALLLLLFQLRLEGLLAFGYLLGLVFEWIEEERAVYCFGREEEVLQALLLLG